jgi:hypothetical protein
VGDPLPQVLLGIDAKPSHSIGLGSLLTSLSSDFETFLTALLSYKGHVAFMVVAKKKIVLSLLKT